MFSFLTVRFRARGPSAPITVGMAEPIAVLPIIKSIRAAGIDTLNGMVGWLNAQ